MSSSLPVFRRSQSRPSRRRTSFSSDSMVSSLSPLFAYQAVQLSGNDFRRIGDENAFGEKA